ncbi:hypothetical protein [Paenibacillus arenilitoris]|uniref:Uncharacterized protein n=1 Tax=Paenibacillus arenilitoris TaxID=2772299 RepID=A0A927H5F1_9BACL|nr:hypothetical protein [Paenibacillus arenilitoris]MBD2868352.1 hypothetical protein [Paenibacillus arenilitoris]
MLIVIGISLLAAVAGTLIWIRNGKKGRKRERAWALLLLAIGTTYAIGVQLRLPMPNPVDGITYLFGPVYKPILGWIQEEL